MRSLCTVFTSVLLFALGACAAVHAPSKERLTPAQLDVRLESDEADAAVAILDQRVRR